LVVVEGAVLVTGPRPVIEVVVAEVVVERGPSWILSIFIIMGWEQLRLLRLVLLV
jgi:hypothetical protein